MSDIVIRVSFKPLITVIFWGMFICTFIAAVCFTFVHNYGTDIRREGNKLPSNVNGRLAYNPFFPNSYNSRQQYETLAGVRKANLPQTEALLEVSARPNNEPPPEKIDPTTVAAADDKSIEDQDETKKPDNDHPVDYLKLIEKRTAKPTYIWDAIITYVNGSDPVFQNHINRHIKESDVKAAADPARFEDHHDLEMLFRSIETHARFFRQIFLVVAYKSQVPFWLNTSHPQIRIIYHRDIFPNTSDLPTFSAAAIEASLHFIPNLSPYALYFNDDYMLVNDVTPDDFHETSPDGEFVFYMRPDGPHNYSLKPMAKYHPKAHWLTQAVNAARLITKVCKKNTLDDIVGYRSWQAHVPTIFLKDVLMEAEKISVVRKSLEYTRRQRFRRRDCVHAFLFHHWYAQCGRRMEASPLPKGEGRADIRNEATDKKHIKKTLNRIKELKARIRKKEVKFLVISDESKGTKVTDIGRKIEKIILQWRLSLLPNKSSFELR